MDVSCSNSGQLRMKEILKTLYEDKWQKGNITKHDILADIHRLLNNGSCERCGQPVGEIVVLFGRVMCLCDKCLDLYKHRKMLILGDK